MKTELTETGDLLRDLRDRVWRACARVGRRLRGEDGFTLMEMVLVSFILLVIAAPLGLALTTAAIVSARTQMRNDADALAAKKIESIRAMSYDQIGLANGNPAGTVTSPDVVDARGNVLVAGHRSVEIVSSIAYGTHTVQGSFETDANYKTVVVKVIRLDDNVQLAQRQTIIASASAPPFGGLQWAQIQANVVDFVLNQPVQGATVALATGPSAPRRDVTDATGSVLFPALTETPAAGPQAYYDVTSTLAGYATYPDDLVPAAAAHMHTPSNQRYKTTLRVYRPATIDVQVLSSSGAPYPGTATVALGSTKCGATLNVTGGSATVTQCSYTGGLTVPVIPGLTWSGSATTATGLYSPVVSSLVPVTGYPGNLAATLVLQLGATSYPTKVLTVTVKDSTGAADVNARVEVKGGPANTYLFGTTNSGGQVNFNVPSGATSYSIAVGDSLQRSGTATATVNGSSAVAVGVTVS